MKTVRRVLAVASLVLGIGIFTFNVFGYTPADRQAGGWYKGPAYQEETRLGLAVGASLTVMGLMLLKRPKA